MKFAASDQIAVNFATVAKGRHKHREAQKNNIGLSVEMTQERDYPACKSRQFRICSHRRSSTKGKSMAKDILVGFGIDVDAVAGWLGSYGGEDSPDDISRGLFAGEVGSPRLLKLFARLGIKTTWFIPGHSIDTFPAEMKAVADAGHEIGIHGYSHENPIAMTREQEMAVLDKCIELVTTLSGRRPAGYVAPWWEFSTVTNELLLERGVKYDHSLMHHDHQPNYVRVRRHLDQDRLLEAAGRMDGAAEAGPGDRPDRDPRELVLGRSPANDVHQEVAEQPRLRQPARHRANVARSVRLGLPRIRLCGVRNVLRLEPRD